jgi:signal transduction histidine kinase
VLLINDDNYVEIVNSIENMTSTLTLKVSLIIISNWKWYVQISLYIRSSNVRYDQIKNFRNSIELHKTHTFLDSNVIQIINVEKIIYESFLFNLQRKKLFRVEINRELIYQMIIKYNSILIRQCNFLINQIYSTLT